MGEIYRTNNPLEFDDVDGIIIDETAPAPSVQGAPANTAILVGRFQRGPDNELIEPGSIGRLLELYGAYMSSGRKQIVNKKFGRLRIIRTVASDATKATYTHESKIKFDAKYKGSYGNNIEVVIDSENVVIPAVAQVETLTHGVQTDRDGWLLYDSNGSVAVVIDLNSAGNPLPAWATAADRVIDIPVSSGTPSVLNNALVAALDGDSEFSATNPNGTTVVVTQTVAGDVQDGAYQGAESGFGISVTTQGADASTVDDSDGVDITITDKNSDAVLQQEIYKNVQIANVGSTFANSELVDVTVLDTGSGELGSLSATLLASGSDGTEADTDYEASIAVAEQENAGNVLWTDKYSATIKGYLKQHVLNAPDKMVIVSTDSPEANLATALSDVNGYRDTEGRIIYAFNGLQTRISGILEWTSAASWMASIISNTAPHIDPAYAQNIQYTLGATDVKNKLTRSQFIQLKEAGIAGIEFDRDLGGFKFRSGIVTQILNSSKVTILRRRMTDFLTTSYAQFLKNYQNAPNTQAKRSEVKGQLLAFDDGLINDGILPSDNELNEGNARLYDTESLNTANVLAQGFFKILIKRRIYSSMRFIVIQAEIGESVIVTEGDN